MFTLYKAKLNTAGKTPEQIRSNFEGNIGPYQVKKKFKVG